MNIAIIGRTEMLYDTAKMLLNKGFRIPLIITAKETPEYKKTSKDFEHLANNIGAKFLCTPSLEKVEVKELIKSIPDIDIAVSINFTGVISQKVINLFNIGVLNAHGGDLPRYRGNACQAWAIINGEDKIGLCIHKMIGGELDSGQIIARAYFDININTRVKIVYDWIQTKVPSLFVEAIEQLSTNKEYCIEKQSTDSKDALRCFPRMPKDGKIDWTQSAESIVRLINASSEPYSGAFCELNEEKIIIWRAELYEDGERYLAVPGQIAELHSFSGDAIIIAGDSKIKISDIEIAGVRGKPTEFIKSIRLRLV